MYALRTLHCISTQYARSPEPGTALRTILAAADLLRAKACVVISPDSTTIEPDWLQRLVRPVYNDNFDLVSPIYRRQKFEGLLMRNLLYPMTRAIYGYGIREPYASEFAISGRLATDFLGKEIWNDEWGRDRRGNIPHHHGHHREIPHVPIFPGNEGAGRSKCQRFGRRPCAERWAHCSSPWIATFRCGVRSPALSLCPLWERQSEVIAGTVASGPQAACERCLSTGVAELEPVFRSILSASTLSELQRIAALEANEFSYPADLWAKTVFEFAASYHKSVISRDHIVQALVPLYRGRALTFLLENHEMFPRKTSRRTRNLCAASSND